MHKPILCEILGVEVRERFTFNSTTYYISDNGYVFEDDDKACIIDSAILCDLIEHPDWIIHEARWTQQDIDDAKYLRRFFPSAKTVWRHTNPDYGVNVMIVENDSWDIRILNEDCFPSLRKDDKEVKLDDILKAGCKNE